MGEHILKIKRKLKALLIVWEVQVNPSGYGRLLEVGLCLYGTKETSSGLWTLRWTEKQCQEKRGEEHTYVDVCLLKVKTMV
jgi:hypothetical protein